MHGESAGGNIAVVLALLARDEGGLSPPLTGVSASIPAVLPAEVVPERFKAEYKSHEQNKNAPGLDEGAFGFFVGECCSFSLFLSFFPPLWGLGLGVMRSVEELR